MLGAHRGQCGTRDSPEKITQNPTVLPLFTLLNIQSVQLQVFFKDFIYLFLERGEGKEKERETSMCGCVSHAPYWGPGLQPRHGP